MKLEDIKFLFNLEKHQILEYILLLLSTIVSGFILVININPTYLTELTTFKICLLSLAYILPIWVFNFIVLGTFGLYFIELIGKLSISLLKLPNDIERALLPFIEKLSYTSEYFGLEPLRQISYIFTILSVYMTICINYFYNLKSSIIYLTIFIINIMLCIILYFILSSSIKEKGPEMIKNHIKNIIKDLPSDFKDKIEKIKDIFNKIK